MHPLIARFLSPDAAREAFRKEKAGEALTPEEQSFCSTAAAHPRQRAELLGLSGRALSTDAQAALVLLAAHSAARALSEDPALAQASREAREALLSEGANEEETEAFIASILLEEAFGYEQEVDTFDTEYVRQTLAEVPALASLTREGVDALALGFQVGGASEEERKARAHMAKALFDIAWAEGPTPINPEHLEMLIEAELTEQPEEEQDRRIRALLQLLELLGREGLVGPQRLARLKEQLGED